ncbi:MAG: preprotein translocase subunit SecE [Deltaproteobacteria bacterium]|nr:preprotein translocase subunit SecE [Deltaproteobacteria bacterium]
MVDIERARHGPMRRPRDAARTTEEGKRWPIRTRKKGTEKKAGAAKPNPVKQLVDFLSDVRRELKKVAWPTRADTLASTWVVIAISFVFSVFFFLCDSVLMFLMKLTFV